MAYRLGNFFSAARDFERTAWQQAFERLLRQRELLQDEWEYDRKWRSTHPSKLIREFTRGPVGLEHASDVFLVDFVMPRLAGDQVEFPYTARHLAEALARDDDINEKEEEHDAR
jgi:hypothetical protein